MVSPPVDRRTHKEKSLLFGSGTLDSEYVFPSSATVVC
jgi:hypothetical protein